MNFKKMAEIFSWMDNARWETQKKWRVWTIGDERFRELKEIQKVLVHWLCYINDYQRNVGNVWEKGGIVFTEIVKEMEETGNGRELLKSIKKKFVGKERGKRIIKPFNYKNTVFGPTDWGALYGVLRTLYFLKEDYKGDLLEYIKRHMKGKNMEEKMNNLSKELYKLSYDRIGEAKSKKDDSKNTEKHLSLKNWWDKDGDMKRVINSFLNDKKDVSSKVKNWYKKGKYKGTKRLWASIRDYLKCPYFKELNIDGRKLKEILGGNEALNYIELPGDRWNKRFAGNVIKDFAKKENIGVSSFSKAIRDLYDRFLKNKGEYYPEQMDVTFDFTPRMCGECKPGNGIINICPFGKGDKLSKFCIGDKTPGGIYCPFLLFSCGYRHECDPNNCPIYEIKKEGGGLEICGENKKTDS